MTHVGHTSFNLDSQDPEKPPNIETIMTEETNRKESDADGSLKESLAQSAAQSTMEAPSNAGDKFSPYDLPKAPVIPSGLPTEIWTIVQSAPANFPPQYFLDVSLNLLENPNLTASHLARAELSYKSFTDATFNPSATAPDDLASIIKHLRPECRPRLVDGGVAGHKLEWTVVRKLVPRNPKLDEAMMQTCHLFTSSEDITIVNTSGEKEVVKAERYMVIYLPHAASPDAIPFYHPKVRALGIQYTYLHSTSLNSPGTLSIHYDLFPSMPLDNRLQRTALKLLEIIHKHARGRQAGYKKRVHHDVIIPQKKFQDTYAYLKGKYAKSLIDGWVEQTPAEKHVFEDLGIAAFLVELWVGMYAGEGEPAQEETQEQKVKTAQDRFPGFVDIGCGNGLLVYILNEEGWPGWGFDARKRKTWTVFGKHYEDKLKAMLLIPDILLPSSEEKENAATTLTHAPPSHNGIFRTGTFIISNHADELTPWTPLLAYFSSSPFIAIPCCSHDFGGTRFRAPVHREYVNEDPNATGKEKNKQPSAYAGLCSWISHLTAAVGYKVEKEHLRIPSTRNIAILGRVEAEGKHVAAAPKEEEERIEFVRGLVEKEMGGATTIEQVRRLWLRSGGELVKPKKGGH